MGSEEGYFYKQRGGLGGGILIIRYSERIYT